MLGRGVAELTGEKGAGVGTGWLGDSLRNVMATRGSKTHRQSGRERADVRRSSTREDDGWAVDGRMGFLVWGLEVGWCGRGSLPERVRGRLRPPYCGDGGAVFAQGGGSGPGDASPPGRGRP